MIFIDIETLPSQDEAIKKQIFDEVVVTCPFKNKGDTGKDLGMTPEEIKFIGAGDLQARWIKEKGEEAKQTQGKEKYLKTGLDGTYGEICSISWAVGDGKIKALCRDGKDSEHKLLGVFWELLLRDTDRASLNFVAHNKKFDLSFVWHRSVINNVKPSIRFEPHSREHYCTMEEWAGYGKFIGLDRLAKALGLEGKSGEGCQVFDWWEAGEYEKIAEYNKDDVRLLREVYNRMTFK